MPAADTMIASSSPLRRRGRIVGRCALGLAALSALLLPFPAPADEAWRVRNWSAGAGMPTDSFNGIVELQDGRLLLYGVYSAPALFDGHRIRALPLHGEDAALLSGAGRAVQLPDGSLWFATYLRGLLRVHPGGRVERVPLPRAEGQQHSVRDLLPTRRGELLVGTAGGLYRIDRPGDEAVLARGPELEQFAVTALHEDRAGALWIGTEHGLYRRHAGQVEAIPDVRFETYIWDLVQDRSERIWVAARGSGLARQTEEGWRFFNRDTGFPHDVVRHVTEATDGSIWAAMPGGGLAQLRDDRLLVRLDSTHGLSGDSYFHVHLDVTGTLWAVGPGLGLDRIQPGAFSTWTRSEGLAGAFTTALFEDSRGWFWAGSNAGVARRRGGEVQVLGSPGSGNQAFVRAFLELPDGGILVGTQNGVFEWRSGGFQPWPGSEGGGFGAFCQEADGTLWAGGNGLFRLTPDRRAEPVPPPGPEAFSITALRPAPEGGVLALTPGSGEWHWHAGRWRQTRALDGTTALRARWVDPDGREWLLGAQLYWVDDGGQARALPGSAAYATRGLHAALEDGAGGLWISGNGGLFRFDIDALRQYATGLGPEPRPRRFDRSDGLASTEFNGTGQFSAWRRRDGSLWFAGANGPTRVAPARFERAAVPLHLDIDQIEANDRVLAANAGMELATGTRRVVLHYAALPPAIGDEVRLSYRLQPQMPDWVEADAARSALFPDLQPGAYRFELRARDDAGEKLGEASLDFSIRPGFWQRSSVRWGLALLALTLLLSLPLGHIRALRAQRRRLLQEVADKTRALEHLAATDALTGLFNRRVFEAELTQMLRHGRPGLLLIDVDHFKRYNDALGHAAGDHCLKQVAQALTRAVRHQGDVVARLGGEEFALLLPQASAELLRGLDQRVRAQLEALDLSHPDSPTASRVTVSAGAALAEPGGRAETLYARADAALYRAKEQGRNRLAVDPA